jgi:hypothetical protein
MDLVRDSDWGFVNVIPEPIIPQKWDEESLSLFLSYYVIKFSMTDMGFYITTPTKFKVASYLEDRGICVYWANSRDTITHTGYMIDDVVRYLNEGIWKVIDIVEIGAKPIK